MILLSFLLLSTDSCIISSPLFLIYGAVDFLPKRKLFYSSLTPSLLLFFSSLDFLRQNLIFKSFHLLPTMETLSNSQDRENPFSPQAPNSYPTTFVQANASSFKQVVQMLTGSAETVAAVAATPPAKILIPTPGKATGPKKPAFKLYERRGSLRNLKAICPLMPSFSAASPRKQTEIMSPSMLDFPSLVLSPVTPLIRDPFNRSPPPPAGSAAALSAEDRAIAEKGFYLHPSPRSDAEPPRLLSLFPETSSKLSSSSSQLSP